MKKIIIGSIVVLAASFGIYKYAFASACCASTDACSTAKVEATSGCTPSNCRGAKTKFGEAKVISDLRLNLIDLKADMEKSAGTSFDERSYDIHGIIGESDDESIEIILKEVQIIEEEFADKLSHQATAFALPDHKAKQIEYLNARIEGLKELL